jgi:hypothetical protein
MDWCSVESLLREISIGLELSSTKADKLHCMLGLCHAIIGNSHATWQITLIECGK